MGRIIGQPQYFKYSELNGGEVLVEAGTYRETTEGKFGPQHMFQEQDGSMKCLNSAGQLNFKIDQLIEGDVCKITFLGKVEIKKGAMAGKEANNFEVEVVDEAKTVAPSNNDDLE